MWIGPTVASALLVAAPAEPERFAVHFGVRDGLPVDDVLVVAQDDTGYLWVGTEVGVSRFDGHQFRRWSPEVIDHRVDLIAAGPSVVAARAEGPAFELDASGARPLADQHGNTWPVVAGCVFDDVDRLWIATPEGLRRRESDGSWSVPFPDLEGTQADGLIWAEGRIWFLSDGTLWRSDREDALVSLGPLRALQSVAGDGDGHVFVLEWHGNTYAVVDDALVPWSDDAPVGGTLARRNATLWRTNSESGLVGFDVSDRSAARVAHADLIGTDATLVDREGALWVGTRRGLLEFPEPDSVTWGQAQGLPSSEVVDLAFDDEGLWVSTTTGLALLPGGVGPPISPSGATVHRAKQLCFDDVGRLWTGAWVPARAPAENENAFVVRVAGRFVEHPGENAGWYTACAPAPGGGVWLAGYGGLFKATTPDVAPAAREGPPRSSWKEFYDVLLEDAAGTLWVAQTGRICGASVAGLDAGAGDWRCDELGVDVTPTDLLQTPSGELWAATRSHGLWHREHDHWQQHPGSASLPAASIYGLDPGRPNGVWVLGSGFAWRVADRLDADGLWIVEESLGTRVGLATSSPARVLELDDGTLWVGSRTGVTRIPSHVRGLPTLPGAVVLVDATANGVGLDGDGPYVLPPDTHAVELRFSALSFRDAGALRYRFRIDDEDRWAEPPAPGIVTLLDPRAGEHRIEVQASADGRRWSASAAVALTLELPWYLRTWALALAAVALAALGYALHRARMIVAIGLEHQRSRIAMDLHDEIGSGLGSIGIAASVVADRSLPDPERRQLARDIVDTATGLGRALGDIVWSLRGSSAHLSALVPFFRERGGQLFAGGEPAFSVEHASAWPEHALTLAQRRNLALIGMEAMHNAARHAAATHVTLRLLPSRKRWMLEVEDDGRGLAISSSTGSVTSGRGLPGLRRRAAEIGAELEVQSRPGGGTTVRVRFDVGARGWARVRRWWGRQPPTSR